MEGRKELCDALKKIAWAYVLLHVNFSIGTINLLPEWAGYLLILSVLPAIGEEEETANLLIPLAKVMVVTGVIFWINDGFLGSAFHLELVNIFADVIALYFHFQLLTNLAAIAKKYNCSQEKTLLALRTVNTLFITFCSVLKLFYEAEVVTYILYVVLAVWVVVTIWLCATLFSLKKELQSGVIV